MSCSDLVICLAVRQTDRGQAEALLYFRLLVKRLSAMYRSASLGNKELMALYEEREHYFVKDEDSSEVRL